MRARLPAPCGARAGVNLGWGGCRPRAGAEGAHAQTFASMLRLRARGVGCTSSTGRAAVGALACTRARARKRGRECVHDAGLLALVSARSRALPRADAVVRLSAKRRRACAPALSRAGARASVHTARAPE